MSTDPHQVECQQEYDPSFIFCTKEEIEARETNSAAPYLRRYDPLCAMVLSIAKTPADIQFISKVFPFFRLASVLHTPTVMDVFGAWLVNAFYAGLHYGRLYPTQAEETAERAFGGHGYSHKRLHIVKEVLCNHPATLQNLVQAFNIIAENCKPEPGYAFEEHLIHTVLKGAGAGFAASTTGQADPALTDFIEQLAMPIDMTRIPLMFRALSESMARAEGRPMTALLSHPLLTLAETQYPYTPIERRTILPFLHHQLRTLGVQSESECPVGDTDLPAWINAGMTYGNTVLMTQPQVVEQIFGELPPGKLQTLKEMASAFWAAAEGLKPCGLVGPLSHWHEKTYSWWNPAFYGEALSRVVRIADFAIWLPWLLSEQERAEARK